MRKQTVKMLLVIICMLAAGICFSCNKGVAIGESQKVWLEETQAIVQETESQMAEIPNRCYVHVCGEVLNPGVYELEEGSRIFQLIEMAGGFTDAAATEYLNMAQIVQDGMKIQVPSLEELDTGEWLGQQGSALEEKPRKINLNTATKEELMTLRGIGEARAEDILRYREEHGTFETIEEIMEISGIKDAAFQKIKEYITV